MRKKKKKNRWHDFYLAIAADGAIVWNAQGWLDTVHTLQTNCDLD